MHIYILRMHTLIHMCRVSIIKLFLKTPTTLLKGIKNFNDKINNFTRKSPLVILTCWSLNIAKDLEPQGQKGTKDHQSNMANKRIMRMEEIEKRQQDMQEKVFQVTEMVTSLTKRKRITEDPGSQDRLASWKNNDCQFAVLNPNNLCEQEKLRKDPSRWLELINVQQRCSF